MTTLTKRYAWFGVCTLATTLLSHATDAAKSSTPATDPVAPLVSTVTNQVVIKPADAAEFAALKANEKTLVAQQHALELKIFKVFRDLHVAREESVKGDDELTAMAREIARKQAELEKRTAEKYPDLGRMTKERDAMTKEHSALGEQLRDIRKRMDIIQGLLPADVKPAAPVAK